MKGNQHSDADSTFPPLFEAARKIAVVLLRIESLFLVGLVIYLFGAAISKGVEAPGALAGEIIFALAASAGLLICSRGFAARRSYGRAPALLANLILLGVSYFMISGHLLWVGANLALFAGVTAIACLLGYTE
jgi:hypothetical protein